MSAWLAGLIIGALIIAGLGVYARYGLKRRVDLIAYPKGEPAQTAAVHFIGTPARGATLANKRGAPELRDGWAALGYAIAHDPDHIPVILLEEGGPPMPIHRTDLKEAPDAP